MNPQEADSDRIRWGRSQKFQLSTAGREAGLNYRDGIVAARAVAGRASFDAAGVEWAARFKLQPVDALYLRELLDGPRTIEEITTSLDGCGPQKSDVRKAVDRLLLVGMMEPVPQAVSPAPLPFRR